MMYKKSIIVPFFNEEKRVDDSFRIISSFLKNNKDIEAIYVNDGSTDSSEIKLKDLIDSKESIKIIGYEKNRGKGHAVKYGMMQAQGEFCLYTDFDFSISLKEIDKFIKRLNGKRGVVIASRKEDGVVHKKQSLLRRLMGRTFNLIMKFIVTLPVKDTQCGFKLFDRESAKKIFSSLNTNGFAFDVEVLLLAYKYGIPVYEEGVEITNDDERSTINIFIDPFKMLWELILIKIRVMRS